jgi:hypothetical protein
MNLNPSRLCGWHVGSPSAEIISDEWKQYFELWTIRSVRLTWILTVMA